MNSGLPPVLVVAAVTIMAPGLIHQYTLNTRSTRHILLYRRDKKKVAPLLTKEREKGLLLVPPTKRDKSDTTATSYQQRGKHR